MSVGTFRRDQPLLFLARCRLAQVDASRGFLPEPPLPLTEAGALALVACQSPALADAGVREGST